MGSFVSLWSPTGRPPAGRFPRLSTMPGSNASRSTRLGYVSGRSTNSASTPCPTVPLIRSKLSSVVSKKRWQRPTCSIPKRFLGGSVQGSRAQASSTGTDNEQQESHTCCCAHCPPRRARHPRSQVLLALRHAEVRGVQTDSDE